MQPSPAVKYLISTPSELSEQAKNLSHSYVAL